MSYLASPSGTLQVCFGGCLLSILHLRLSCMYYKASQIATETLTKTPTKA